MIRSIAWLCVMSLAAVAVGCSGGAAGIAGATGAQGPAGATGVAGPAAATGPAGLQGLTGNTGPTGAPGEPGALGAAGETGLAGAAGATGPTGATGVKGNSGSAGTSVTTTVLASGNQSCPDGGLKVTSSTGDVFVCNGAAGAAGSSPTVTADTTHCTNGGVQITINSSSTYVCNGGNGTNGTAGQSVTANALSANDVNCPSGGAQFTVGSTVTYACNGADATAPAGTIVAYGGAVAPAGWAACDGNLYSAATQANLFAAIGYTYGGGAGNFNVPDLRGRSVIGSGSGAGLTARAPGDIGGEEGHHLTAAEMPSHTHYVPSGAYANTTAATAPGTTDTAGYQGFYGAQTTGAAGGDQLHNTMMPFLVLGYLIKL